MSTQVIESPESYFRRRGLEPRDWEQTLRSVEGALKPAEVPVFRATHRSFIAYPNESTCRAFYDFIADHGLMGTLASFRFHRLRRIAASLVPLSLRDKEVIDLGAGAGYLSGFVRDVLGAKVRVADWSEKTLRYLSSEGYAVFQGPEFPTTSTSHADFLLCADSLGEVHSDEDGWLRDPEHFEDPHYAEELESRYGFAEKLERWKPLLSQAGCVLLFEPIPVPDFWKGLADDLSRSGWKAAVCGPEPLWYLVATPE